MDFFYKYIWFVYLSHLFFKHRLSCLLCLVLTLATTLQLVN